MELNTSLEKSIEQLRGGSTRTLASLITKVENCKPDWINIMKAVYPFTGSAPIIGFTGPAGAGKSSLTCGVVQQMVCKGYRPGIIAVDPSSPFSGGVFLGDRCRMRPIESLPEVFIRSMSSKGTMGGLNPAVLHVTRLMEAYGQNIIMIETVGAGQDEIDIARVADLVVVILSPGQGDTVQMLKCGLMEIGDIFAVNKSDLPGADELVGQIKVMLNSGLNKEDEQIPLLKTSAGKGSGVAELTETIFKKLRKMGSDDFRRKERIRWEIIRHLETEIFEIVRRKCFYDQRFEERLNLIANGSVDPYTMIEVELEKFLGTNK